MNIEFYSAEAAIPEMGACAPHSGNKARVNLVLGTIMQALAIISLHSYEGYVDASPLLFPVA